MKKMNQKGFTMAELLIVVAIIAVLVAIAIPIFTAQLEKSREATDLANIRAAYAEVSANAISDPTSVTPIDVDQKQTKNSWDHIAATEKVGGVAISTYAPNGNGWTVAYDATNEKVTITSKTSTTP